MAVMKTLALVILVCWSIPGFTQIPVYSIKANTPLVRIKVNTNTSNWRLVTPGKQELFERHWTPLFN